MVSQMVFQMVFIFGDKRTLGTAQHFFWLYVGLGVAPKFFLGHRYKFTLFALEHLNLTLK